MPAARLAPPTQEPREDGVVLGDRIVFAGILVQ